MADETLKYRILKKSEAAVNRLGKCIDAGSEASKYESAAKSRVKRIGGGYRGSNKEFRDTVLSYWKKYGEKPDRFWFDLYCDGMEAYDPRFIPDTIWFLKILPYFNSKKMIAAYQDKAVFSRILPDVKKPETIVKMIGGYYYNGDGEQLITREEAEQICESEEHLIVKPSRGKKGSGILFYDRDNEGSSRIPEIFDAMERGFVAQRIVKQHADLARLNPGTLNTLRVISFHFKGEVNVLSAQLRIGGPNSRVDNVSAGGSACAVYQDGRLHERSVTRKSTWTDETASGIKLSTIRVPNYEDVVETIKRLHCELPYFNIIGWDFAVGEDGTPIMVEFNVLPGQNQIGGREPTFGDLTDEVLEDVYIKKSLKNAFAR